VAFPFSLGAERLRDLDLEFLSALRDLLLLLFPDPDRDLERLRDLLRDLELLLDRLLRSRERLLERLRDLSTQKKYQREKTLVARATHPNRTPTKRNSGGETKVQND
jgi:hypothetical protein